MIRIVTEPASMLPDQLRERYAVDVVALTITLDGEDYREGVDLTTAEFYARLAANAEVTTAAPAPGAFVDAYRAATVSGASGVLSVHTGSAYSATVASATLAAHLVDVPVTIVDTGVASFPVSMAVWSAAEHLAEGSTTEEAARSARWTADRVGSLFVVGVPEVARRGGRFVTVDGELTPTTVLELAAGALHDRGRADDADAAVEMMIERTIRLAHRNRSGSVSATPSTTTSPNCSPSASPTDPASSRSRRTRSARPSVLTPDRAPSVSSTHRSSRGT